MGNKKSLKVNFESIMNSRKTAKLINGSANVCYEKGVEAGFNVVSDSYGKIGYGDCVVGERELVSLGVTSYQDFDVGDINVLAFHVHPFPSSFCPSSGYDDGMGDLATLINMKRHKPYFDGSESDEFIVRPVMAIGSFQSLDCLEVLFLQEKGEGVRDARSVFAYELGGDFCYNFNNDEIFEGYQKMLGLNALRIVYERNGRRNFKMSEGKEGLSVFNYSIDWD
jgi:hypothetical protein